MAVSARKSWFNVYDASGESEDALRAGVRDAFVRGGVRALRIVNASPGADPLTFWNGVGSALGSAYAIGADGAIDIVKRDGADWMDVRFDPQRQHSFRHANSAQPLHTDSAHVATRPGFALMVMAKQSASGGETVLADVATIARIAQSEDPALFADMTQLPVNMALPPASGSHEPVLQKHGDRWSMRWNYYRVVPGQGERVDAFRERLHAFIARIDASDEAAVFRLEEGDALLLDDGGALHGRRSFAAQAGGDRLMWKTYFER